MNARDRIQEWLTEWQSNHFAIPKSNNIFALWFHFFLWNHIIMRGQYIYSSDEYIPNFADWIIFLYKEGAIKQRKYYTE